MPYLRDLVVGFGQLIADADLPVSFAWPASAAVGDQVPIYAMHVPQQPARVFVLSPVPIGADPTRPMNTSRLQTRSRSAGEDVSDAWEIDDAVQDFLLGYFPMTLPTGIYIKSLSYGGGGSMGQDENGLWTWASNYDLEHYRPTTHRA